MIHVRWFYGDILFINVFDTTSGRQGHFFQHTRFIFNAIYTAVYGAGSVIKHGKVWTIISSIEIAPVILGSREPVGKLGTIVLESISWFAGLGYRG